MDFMPIILAGTDDEETKEVLRKMTDRQFMAMVKLALTAAENTRDIKDFKRVLAFPDNGVGNAFMTMLARLTDNLTDFEKVHQVLKDILMMEGAD